MIERGRSLAERRTALEARFQRRLLERADLPVLGSAVTSTVPLWRWVRRWWARRVLRPYAVEPLPGADELAAELGWAAQLRDELARFDQDELAARHRTPARSVRYLAEGGAVEGYGPRQGESRQSGNTGAVGPGRGWLALDD